MTAHEEYGIRVMELASDGAVAAKSPDSRFRIGDLSTGQIDGTIGDLVAVEIEARTSKQVRGAVVDLMLHPFPRKLLLILNANNNPEKAAAECRHILSGLSDAQSRVVALRGSGNRHEFDHDVPAPSQTRAS